MSMNFMNEESVTATVQEAFFDTGIQIHTSELLSVLGSDRHRSTRAKSLGRV